ncbi:glycosyltransferase family 4 protein [Oricola sp.]|uniref:glycosyltransferase family 4 protein n=1 Tax=Oricola sp. TaxID=1979950 RepID=UPI003BAD92A7
MASLAEPRPRVAFYAPLKPPDHPIPSGDRTFARLFLAALGHAGFDATLASRFIGYQKRPSDALFEQRRAEGLAEAERLIASWDQTTAPELWFTYHPYCKAPDWLGPNIAEHFSIPYVTAEACRTHQNSDADWQRGRHAVQDAVRRADINFCMKETDAAYLASVLDDMGSVRRIAPFADIGALKPADISLPPFDDDAPVIVTAGMMRPGKKLACYQALADALARIADRRWNLVAIGDGPERPAIEAMFAPFDAGRVHITGAIAQPQVLHVMAHADLFVWPGIAEPIGMVYLEAQAMGLPVAAYRSMGVPLVVKDGETGILAPEGDTAAFAGAIARLLDNREMRTSMGAAARRFVRRERSVDGLVQLLKRELGQLIATNQAGKAP